MTTQTIIVRCLIRYALEINGADALEPPIYYVAFAGDSGNNQTISFTLSASSISSTTKRTMLLQRRRNPLRRCNPEKTSCPITSPSSLSASIE